uniref:IVSP1-like protein n=1 Tax=Glypta fumiferanae TaxID=389681 RepID=A0A0F6Q8A9_9HYME|nr:IVSP1-like protein [Glypta fumiferanae]
MGNANVSAGKNDKKIAKETVKPSHVNPPFIDSDVISHKNEAHEAKQKKKHRIARKIFYEYKLLGWLAVCLFSCGFICHLITTWSYIFVNSLLTAGSLLWMLHAILCKDIPTLLQHTSTFGVALYIFVKQIDVSKFAYLSALLFCTSCAVHNHDELPRISTNLCFTKTADTLEYVPVNEPSEMTTVDDRRYNLCKLHRVMTILELKLTPMPPTSLGRETVEGTRRKRRSTDLSLTENPAIITTVSAVSTDINLTEIPVTTPPTPTSTSDDLYFLTLKKLQNVIHNLGKDTGYCS